MIVFSDIQDGIERVRNRNVCLLRNFLQSKGVFEPLVLKVLDMAREKAKLDPEVVLSNGFQNLHKYATAEQIKILCNYLAREWGDKSLRDTMARFTYDVVRNDLGVKGKFYLDHQPIVRFYTPQDFWSENVGHLSLGGHLKIQGPHHDTWFGHSYEGMNLWMAMGPVRKGNGLSIYPEVSDYIEHDGKYSMPRDQSLGKPVNFDMSPGDMLFFHGEMVHASELNRTDETRFVLTTRFSLQPPSFADDPHGGKSPWITSEDLE